MLLHFVDGTVQRRGYGVRSMAEAIDGMYSEPPTITHYELEGRDC